MCQCYRVKYIFFIVLYRSHFYHTQMSISAYLRILFFHLRCHTLQHVHTRTPLFVFKDNLLSLVHDCSLYICINIHIYERCVCCQVSLGRNGFNCETNSWQPRRLLRPRSPPPHPPDLFTCPDCVPPHLFNRRVQTAGLNEKSALLFCLWPTPVVMEPLPSPCPRVDDKLRVKIFRNSDWTVQEDPSTNKLLSTGEAGWSGLPPHTLQYSKMAHRKNTGLLVG